MRGEAPAGDRAHTPRLDRSTPVGFIGAGRFGTSMAAAMSRAGYNVAVVASRSAASAQEFADRVPSAAVVAADPAEIARAVDVVFIATSDAVIPEVCAKVAWRPGQGVVHPSGVTPLSALAPAADAGAMTGGFHVLQTFANRDSAHLIPGAACALDASDPALYRWLEGLAGDVGARPFRIRDEHRAAYHASAIMSCGLIAAMAGLAAEMWQTMGIGRREALEALHPLISATVEGIRAGGLPAAFTGPFVRGDVATVAKHLEAVGMQSPDAARAYAAVAFAGLPMFAEQGGLTADTARDLATVLRHALVSLEGR